VLAGSTTSDSHPCHPWDLRPGSEPASSITADQRPQNATKPHDFLGARTDVLRARATAAGRRIAPCRRKRSPLKPTSPADAVPRPTAGNPPGLPGPVWSAGQDASRDVTAATSTRSCGVTRSGPAQPGHEQSLENTPKGTINHQGRGREGSERGSFVSTARQVRRETHAMGAGASRSARPSLRQTAPQMKRLSPMGCHNGQRGRSSPTLWWGITGSVPTHPAGMPQPSLRPTEPPSHWLRSERLGRGRGDHLPASLPLLFYVLLNWESDYIVRLIGATREGGSLPGFGQVWPPQCILTVRADPAALQGEVRHLQQPKLTCPCSSSDFQNTKNTKIK